MIRRRTLKFPSLFLLQCSFLRWSTHIVWFVWFQGLCCFSTKITVVGNFRVCVSPDCFSWQWVDCSLFVGSLGRACAGDWWLLSACRPLFLRWYHMRLMSCIGWHWVWSPRHKQISVCAYLVYVRECAFRIIRNAHSGWLSVHSDGCNNKQSAFEYLMHVRVCCARECEIWIIRNEND